MAFQLRKDAIEMVRCALNNDAMIRATCKYTRRLWEDNDEL